jgi:glycosyltransferase involved in cell wall biosynthesis
LASLAGWANVDYEWNETMTVSVVIPAWNASARPRLTIESVLAQTVAPFEIIDVKDGSSAGDGLTVDVV